MSTLEPQKSILDEALTPHLASEEGQAFLLGQARLERIQVYCAPDNFPNPPVLQLELYFLPPGIDSLPPSVLLPFSSHALKYKAQNLEERQRHQNPSSHKY